jgi:carbon-monoxide dehydrogenase large subunit
MDYAMPRSDHMPNIVTETVSTLCTHNGLGVKGCGEVGTIGSPATVMNAVVDAVSHLGVNHVDMPATPNRIWRIMNSARAARAA